MLKNANGSGYWSRMTWNEIVSCFLELKIMRLKWRPFDNYYARTVTRLFSIKISPPLTPTPTHSHQHTLTHCFQTIFLGPCWARFLLSTDPQQISAYPTPPPSPFHVVTWIYMCGLYDPCRYQNKNRTKQNEESRQKLHLYGQHNHEDLLVVLCDYYHCSILKLL